jgi:mono/diheme cytochrome c family protein
MRKPQASNSPTFNERRAARLLLTALALLGMSLLPVLVGCDSGLPAGRTPHWEFNFIDMGDQPKLKPQRRDLFGSRPTGVLKPPMGAIATDETPYPYAQKDGEAAGAARKNPLPGTPKTLAHGQFVFENVCITCHGAKAAGDGLLTSVFPKPPSLMTQKLRDWSDGRIFHLPMRGQGSMPSQARQIDARDIWSVVHYIRKLQRELPVAPPPVIQATPTAKEENPS